MAQHGNKYKNQTTGNKCCEISQFERHMNPLECWVMIIKMLNWFSLD